MYLEVNGQIERDVVLFCSNDPGRRFYQESGTHGWLAATRLAHRQRRVQLTCVPRFRLADGMRHCPC